MEISVNKNNIPHEFSESNKKQENFVQQVEKDNGKQQNQSMEKTGTINNNSRTRTHRNSQQKMMMMMQQNENKDNCKDTGQNLLIDDNENQFDKEFDLIYQNQVDMPNGIPQKTQENEQIYNEYIKRQQTQEKIQQLKKDKKKIQSLDELQVNENEKVFLILNKDTGEVYDMRLDQVVDIARKSEIINYENAKQKPDIWKEFWESLNSIHQDLIDAAETGKLGQIQEILEEKSVLYPVDCNHRDLDDWTPLHKAANEGYLEIVKLLLDHKADPNLSTRQGLTALHFAANRGFLEVTAVLLSFKCKVNLQDEQKNTPLHYATEHNHKEIVELLLQFKASNELKNFQQLKPSEASVSQDVEQIYIQYGHKDTVKQSFSRSRKDFVEKMLQQKPHSLQAINQNVNMIRSEQIKFQQINGPEDFEYYKLLGKGAFGEVYLVKFKNSVDQQFYALKILKKDKIKQNNLLRYAKIEKDIMHIMNHPFVVKLIYAFQSETRLFLVMEFCPGGDLAKLLDKYDKLPEEYARFFLAEVLLAIEALHKNFIIFRDLKPSNVLINEDGHAMLTDFGLANIKNEDFESLRRSFCGTPAYLAPEMVKKQGHNRMIDWYLLGVLLYEMLTGLTPYYADTKEQLYQNILKGPLRMPSKGISEEAKDLIVKLLNRNPQKRLGYNGDAEEIKKHPFWKDIDFDEIYKKSKPGPLKIEKFNIPQKSLPIKFDEIKVEQSQDILKVEDWSMAMNEVQYQMKINNDLQE